MLPSTPLALPQCFCILGHEENVNKREESGHRNERGNWQMRMFSMILELQKAFDVADNY